MYDILLPQLVSIILYLITFFSSSINPFFMKNNHRFQQENEIYLKFKTHNLPVPNDQDSKMIQIPFLLHHEDEV